jgi:hypothetical protein
MGHEVVFLLSKAHMGGKKQEKEQQKGFLESAIDNSFAS